MKDFMNNVPYSKYALDTANTIGETLIDIVQTSKNAAASAYHFAKDTMTSVLSYFSVMVKPTNTPENHAKSAASYNESAQQDWKEMKDYASKTSSETKHVFKDAKEIFVDGGNVFMSSKAAINILYNILHASSDQDENAILLNEDDLNNASNDDTNTFKNAAYETLKALGYTAKIPLDVAKTLFDTLGVAYNGAQSVRYGAQYTGHKAGEAYHQTCKMYDEMYNRYNGDTSSSAEAAGDNNDDWCEIPEYLG